MQFYSFISAADKTVTRHHHGVCDMIAAICTCIGSQKNAASSSHDVTLTLVVIMRAVQRFVDATTRVAIDDC